MAVRSVSIKRKLIQMTEGRFPGFRFVSKSGSGIYGFVRERPGCWYDYLPINQYFQGDKGVMSINWYWIGGGYVPDWYEWNGIANTPWRVLAWPPRQPDPGEPPSRLAAPGHDAAVCYQDGPLAQADQALEVLRDKLERYALPALERPVRPSDEERLRQWGLLARLILPQLRQLELQAPEEFEALKVWQKRTARRRKNGMDEDVPPVLARWREEIRQLPGFAEQWDVSAALRGWTFDWFTHALYLHP